MANKEKNKIPQFVRNKIRARAIAKKKKEKEREESFQKDLERSNCSLCKGRGLACIDDEGASNGIAWVKCPKCNERK